MNFKEAYEALIAGETVYSHGVSFKYDAALREILVDSLFYVDTDDFVSMHSDSEFYTLEPQRRIG